MLDIFRLARSAAAAAFDSAVGDSCSHHAPCGGTRARVTSGFLSFYRPIASSAEILEVICQPAHLTITGAASACISLPHSLPWVFLFRSLFDKLAPATQTQARSGRSRLFLPLRTSGLLPQQRLPGLQHAARVRTLFAPGLSANRPGPEPATWELAQGAGRGKYRRCANSTPRPAAIGYSRSLNWMAIRARYASPAGSTGLSPTFPFPTTASSGAAWKRPNAAWFLR